MIFRNVVGLAVSLFVLTVWAADTAVLEAAADDPDKPNSEFPRFKTVEEISKTARQSLAVVSHFDRDGEEDGIGSGFVVSADGLIVTCFHVIDEARPIAVQLADGSRHEVTEVFAWDRKLDLAVIRIDATDLPALRLGDSESLNQGEPVVAMGNPLGLKYSVVSGVVSARREFDGVEMIQLAIPIEEGNSGGPVMDMRGAVHGVLNMKSLLSPNLGFALPVNLLKPLLSKPNPVPMSRWLTIGRLNPRVWRPVMGARWTQRGGGIHVESQGRGFGGRALCISEIPVPARPYELAVTVRLENEAGAAGLAFEFDGDQKHYGFYPSAGRLRLTRFDGPTVYSWNILQEVSSEFYHPGEWNRLKVRVEKDKIFCYVNDHLVIESPDSGLTGGSAGLSKFRDTRASYKNFQLGAELDDSYDAPAPDVAAAMTRLIKDRDARPRSDWFPELARNPGASRAILAERARELDAEAAKLRALSEEVHRESVRKELVDELEKPEAEIDLLSAALLVSKLDHPDLDVANYLDQVDQMARDFVERASADGQTHTTLDGLIEYLFQENGFHGSRTDYYNRANSYMNNVIDDREGLPITLSVLFMELASRVGIDRVFGVSLPGHFIVKHVSKSGEERLIDVFDNGKRLQREEANSIVQASVGRSLKDEDLRAATKREIIRRILRNLSGIAIDAEPGPGSLRYADLIVAISPENAWERLDRALLRVRVGDRAGAKDDLLWLMEKQPEAIDLERISGLYHSL